MEEENLLRTKTARPTKYSLLLLSLFLLLAACSGEPTPVGQPTIAPTATVERAAASQTPSTQSTLPAPALEASYLGVHFTYDEASIGHLQEATRHPATASGQEDTKPEHLQFSFASSGGLEKARVLIFPVAQYEAISPEAVVHIEALRALLSEPSTMADRPLPLLPLLSAKAIPHSEPTYVNFQNGQGISYVTGVSLDPETDPLAAPTLYYTFQGLTTDGSFYVAALFPLSENDNPVGSRTASGESVTQVTDRREALAADLQVILPLLDNAIRTLEISPDNEFPSAAPPALASFPGVLIAYDPDLSGEISFEKTPAIWIASDGSTRYLDAVPDKIQIEFSDHESLSQPASLLIQPIRDGQNRFFEAIPADLQGLVSDLEIRFSNDNNVSNKEKTLEHLLTFNSGLGFRQIREASAPAGAQDPPHLTYHFEGVTQDGLYYVQFDDPIHLTGSVDEVVLNANAPESAAFLNVLAQLDSMVQSLSISPDASIYSSVPINPSDCTNDAQFITDVTIPDHTLIERGETFTKKWLVRNTGTCSWTPKYKIALGGGNPLTWSNAAISVVVPPEQEIELSVKVLSPEVPGNYQAWWRLTDENGEPFGPSFSVQFETPRPATDIPGYGVVEGSLSYPAGGMPAMTIYFLHTDGSQRYALETEQGWTRYANEIPAGEYYVFARVSGDESDTGGGFTEAAVCELMCEDHTLVEVMIEEGKATREVNIMDWYAPAGTFPLPDVSP